MKQAALSRKQLLKDVPTATDAWLQQNADTEQSPHVQALRDALTALLDKKKQLDDEQNALKGAVGRAKKAGESADELIARMRSSASKLKNLDRSVNDTADRLLDLVRAGDAAKIIPSVPVPARFLAPHWSQTESASVSKQIDGDLDQKNSYLDENKTPGTAAWHVSETISPHQWDTYVSTHPEATHYHHWTWQSIISRNFPQQHWYVGVLDSSGEITGVLSLVYMNSPVTGRYLLSMPWLIYGGCLASDSHASELLADYAKKKVVELGCSHVELRQIHTRTDWHPMPGKVSMVLGLPKSTEELNSGFGAALRSQIKGATAHGPSVEFGGADLVSDFYTVFSEKMRDLGTPVYDKAFFEDIFRHFDDSTTCVIVRLKGRPVAAAILINYRDTIEVPWAAARKKYNALGVNMFMYHQILEFSVTQGFGFFDFGRSTIDTGTYQFKKQWGAKPYALGWHRFPYNVAENGNNERVSLKFRIAMVVWKRIPVWLTRIIGPPVSRHLPW